MGRYVSVTELLQGTMEALQSDGMLQYVTELLSLMDYGTVAGRYGTSQKCYGTLRKRCRTVTLNIDFAHL